MAQNPKKNKSLAPVVDSGYNKPKDTGGSYTGSTTGFQTSKPAVNTMKTTVYKPDGSYERKEPKTTSYWNKARETTAQLNKSLPRINDAPKYKAQTTPTVKPISTYSDIPKKGESFFTTKSVNSLNNESLTNEYAKKYNLPNWDERNFAKGVFGEKAETAAYKRELDNIINPKPPKTQDELFHKGFFGIEDDEWETTFDDGKPEYKIQTAPSQIMENVKSNIATEAKRRDEEYRVANPNMKIYTNEQIDQMYPGLRESQRKKSEDKSFWEDPKGTVSDIWGNAKETAGELWESTKDTVGGFWEDTKSAAKNLANGASSWANEKGFFDDATNAFFKAYDASREFPIKILPTDALHQSIADENYKENQKIDLSKYDKTGGYINDQRDINAPASQIRYGNGTLHDNGCEIIAVNNALVTLGDRKDIRDIAKEFETNGQTAFGYFGTSPFAADDYFVRKGYQVETFTGDKEIYNLDIPDADTYIVSFWNSDKVTSMIHTVAVDKLPNGKYRMYNVGGQAKEIDSLNAYFLEENSIPLVLHCIKKG